MGYILLGLDERCFCNCSNKCCLGRCGMSSRCTKKELEDAGYRTIQVVNEASSSAFWKEETMIVKVNERYFPDFETDDEDE